MRIEVAYCAGPDEEDLRLVELAAGATVRDALAASGLRERHPTLPAEPRIGVWARACPMDRTLRDGDRVEIYRPLAIDPKEARRQRQRRQREARSAAVNGSRGP